MVAIMETNKSERSQRLEDRDWDALLKQIKKGKCTPIIGQQACNGLYPLKGDRALKWAEDEDYPLDNCNELARLAEFLAVRDYPARPIERLTEEFENIQTPDYTDPDEFHTVLASLPLPVYITTNYDDFMFSALRKNVMRDAKREYCRWRDGMDTTSTVFNNGYQPNPPNPVVFHLYGQIDREESLVLTVNDYLQFLVNVSHDHMLIPPLIQGAMTGGSLLFLGYQLDEWDFRILFHTLHTYLPRALTRAHVSVQIVPLVKPSTAEQLEKATRYLNSYFEKELYNTRVYWGTCHEFVQELRERWEASAYARP